MALSSIKYQKGRLKKNFSNGFFKKSCDSTFFFLLKAAESGYVTINQLESTRRVLVRGTGRNVILNINCLKFYPLIYLPKNSRMGKGKGKVKHDAFFAKVSTGVPLFFISNLKIKSFKQFKSDLMLLNIAKSRLPIKVKVCFINKSSYFL